jgi:hypothetical protein
VLVPFQLRVEEKPRERNEASELEGPFHKPPECSVLRLESKGRVILSCVADDFGRSGSQDFGVQTNAVVVGMLLPILRLVLPEHALEIRDVEAEDCQLFFGVGVAQGLVTLRLQSQLLDTRRESEVRKIQRTHQLFVREDDFPSVTMIDVVEEVFIHNADEVPHPTILRTLRGVVGCVAQVPQDYDKRPAELDK